MQHLIKQGWLSLLTLLILWGVTSTPAQAREANDGFVIAPFYYLIKDPEFKFCPPPLGPIEFIYRDGKCYKKDSTSTDHHQTITAQEYLDYYFGPGKVVHAGIDPAGERTAVIRYRVLKPNHNEKEVQVPLVKRVSSFLGTEHYFVEIPSLSGAEHYLSGKTLTLEIEKPKRLKKRVGAIAGFSVEVTSREPITFTGSELLEFTDLERVDTPDWLMMDDTP